MNKVNNREFIASGTITIPVSINVAADDCGEALMKIEELINSFNIMMKELRVETEQGRVHKLEVSDAPDVEWDDVGEVEKCKKEDR